MSDKVEKPQPPKRWSKEKQQLATFGMIAFTAVSVVIIALVLIFMKGEAKPKKKNVTAFANLTALTTACDAFLNGTAKNISSWDVSDVKDFSNLFSVKRNPAMANFSGDISKWDVSNATSMVAMFAGAVAFNGNLTTWNVSNVANMTSMFEGASNFSGIGVNKWVPSKLVDMSSTFSGASVFDADLSMWTTGLVTSMKKTFFNATKFAGVGIGGWVSAYCF
jgi:Mycoplasma protein of unknown function, DUF285